MDIIDPLADSAPPRYALESDDEEDEYNPLPHAGSDNALPTEINVMIQGSIEKKKPLLVGSGDAAKYWARGSQLGEQTAGVYVNKVQVGLVFSPTWAHATVIISEITTRLPLWAMYKYAEYVGQEFQPTRISLLDSYAVPAYITDEPQSYYESPVRYLSTQEIRADTIKAFAPPNLVSSTAATFVSYAALSSIPALLVLLPSPHISSPAPRTLSPSSFAHLSEDPVHWSKDIINPAQTALFDFLQVGSVPEWQADKIKTQISGDRKIGRSEIGEGGMYL